MSVLFTTQDQLQKPTPPRRRRTSLGVLILCLLIVLAGVAVFWITRVGDQSGLGSKRAAVPSVHPVQTGTADLKPAAPLLDLPVEPPPPSESAVSSRQSPSAGILEVTRPLPGPQKPVGARIEADGQGFDLVLTLPLDERSDVLRQAFGTGMDIDVSVRMDSNAPCLVAKANIATYRSVPGEDTVDMMLSFDSELEWDALILLMNARLSGNVQLVLSPGRGGSPVAYPFSLPVGSVTDGREDGAR